MRSAFVGCDVCSKYVDNTLEHCRRNFKTVVPLPAINQVQTLCNVSNEQGNGALWWQEA